MGRVKAFLPLLAAVALLGSPAAAQRKAAPEPAKPVDASVYSGRWYEIARTPNSRQKDCFAPVVEFTQSGGQRAFSMTCRRGSPSGRASSQGGRITLTDGARNAKFRAAFVSGVIKTDYFVLDRAADAGWVILGTSGGNYAWVLSRTASLPAAAKDAALARAKALGYATLEMSQH